ncbi:hypothetical protein DQ04_03781010 [Trypanosoma grayi]|uniref:hypothetical protein n=1 Tax=Trypanosoma grayi TaxID=71804 RepID=UPI0004F425F3|nr:hypothetical protein DQ04_03781010 [Trypanosoma grayi]KEG10381.1 hypothetical protein DQ04_03781010 [Trypanosoma grayi]
MSTEVSVVTELPRVVKEPCDSSCNAFLHGNIVEMETRQQVLYGADEQRETNRIAIKGKQQMDDQNSSLGDDAENQKRIQFQQRVVVSFQELYHLWVIAGSFFSAVPVSPSPPVAVGPRRVRSIEMHIPPFVAFSQDLAIALVLWEGIDAEFHDGTYMITTTLLSLLCDGSLQADEKRYSAKLWESLESLKMDAAILEVTGERKTTGGRMMLANNSELSGALLSLGNIFLHLDEEILPLLSQQLTAVHILLSSAIPPIPPPSRTEAAVLSEESRAAFTVSLEEACFGFAWCSRINGLYGELHCNLLALTLTSVGVVTLGDGSVKLKWFNAPPPEGVMGPSILLFREAEEIVPLLESISFTTQTSGHDYPHIKVSPIHIKFSSLTYLHLVELLSYHLKVEANDTDVVEPAICVFASTADKEIEAVAGISSSSVTSRCNVNGDTSAPVSVRDAVAASTEAPNSRCFSVELVEFRFAVEVQRSGDTDDEMKPIVWVQFTNAAWQLLQGAASFMVEEVNCGCDSESQVLSIHGVEFSWLRTNDGVTNLAPEIVCTVESLAVTPTIPSLRRCFDQLIRAPAKEVDPLYWTTKHLSGSISGGVGVSRYNTVNRKMEVVTVDTKLWELKADLVLSRDGGSVLVFSSLNTNNILVEMNGHSIFVEPARKKGADTVMVVDGGLSLTFSGGSFVLPWFLSGKKHMRRVERLGEEVMLLPFMAVGEGSYVRCRNVRYTMSERRELQKQRSAASSSAHRQLWQLQAAIHSLAISVPSQLDQGTVQATLAIDARAYLHGGMMEQGDVTLENLTVVTRTSGVASATAAKSATTENTVLRPVSIHICISEGRDVAFAVGRIVVDATIGDVMLLGAISHEVTRLTHHIMSFRRSPAEREYDLRIQEIMGWKSVPLHADWEDDGDVRHAEDTQGGEPQRGKSTLSLATFSPFVEVTLSNVKYPLLQVTLSDVVWKETMFHTSRTTLLQNQNFYVRVYGKGRWDTVVPAKAVVAFEAVHSWSKRTRTRQLRLQCDTLVVYASQLLLSKIIHINRQWAELQTALLQNLNSGREMMSRKSSVCTSPSSATATHRFINTFSDVFYLFIGKNLDRGEIVPLPSSTAVDLVLPFNRADEVRLYLYPRYCIKLDEDGRHARNDVGLQRDMHYSHVVAGQLQYGHAVGLVVDDLLVVMSCVETEGAHGAVSTSLPMVGAESHGDDAAAPVSPDAHVPIGAVRRADEAGLVIVRIHSRVTLYNGSGMMLEMRQYLLGTPDETPLSDDFWIVPPNAEYPLSGTCSRVELRVLLNGGVYTTSLSTLSLESGVFLDLHPCGDVASRVERLNSSFPVSLFMALRRYVESGSIVVMLFPRITVLNHIGVPVKLSLWQEEQLNDGYGGKGNVDGGAGDSTRFGPNRRVGETSSLWRRWGKFNSSHRYMKIGEHESLAHRGTLAICQCSYRSSLTMSLSFTQTGGETVGTDEPVRVCDSLKKNVEKEPCLLHLHDSNGRRFYVQVSVLHRTIILSVGLWVVNLTEYPILLTDSFASRRLSAGQMQHTGIPPSQGVPFLIGCRPTDFRVVFLTLGLDGDWSDGIPTHLGSHGVVESPRPMAGFTHSCNYVVQFPHVQDGRPMVLLLTPRWVFVNNTNRRLKIYFGLSGMKKKVSEAAKTSSDKHAETSVEATTVSSVTLRPGEHSFSCIGTVVGNLVSFQDTLEDTVPSITSLSSGNARYTNISEFYEVHRTEPMSIDGPGHAVFNLWASLKQPERVPSVAYGALVTSAAPLSLSSPPSSSSSCSDSARISEDAAFVTGRLSVTVQHTDNVLAVVMNSIHATNMVIQNQTRGETIAVRQKGSPRRSIIPPCQNRFFLWEDYCTSPVISLHVVGCKGAWFEVNFSCGTCQVQRCFTSDVTEGALARFYVRAFTSRRDAQHVKILLTDEAVPLHASFDDAWHTSVGRTLSVPSVELVWLTEDRPGNGQRLVSVLLRDMQVQTLNADNTRTVSVLLRRMQVVDGGEGTALVLHRACLANPNAEEDHAGRILSWFWRGEEVPQHDFQAVYTDMMSASGVTRITELSCTLSPFAVNVSDHLVAALWRELRGLQSLLVADGGTMASARESLSSSVSRHAFAKGLVERIRKESDAAAIFIPTHGQGGAGVGPAFLFVDQAHFARVILFVTFTRHKPDPLWQMLGMYTLMIPKRFRGMEFSWPAFVLENKATTQGLLLSQVQRWLVDGAMRQWTKVTRIGKVVDKLKSGARARMELAGAPEPMLPRIHEDDEGEEEEEEEEEGVDED